MGYLLYCIFRGQAQLADIHGVDEEPLSLITRRDLGAVISSLDSSPQRADLSRLLAYERVIASCHRELTIIPMRYGNLLEDTARVESLLESRRPQHNALLDELEGKTEMGIRLLLDADSGDLPGCEQVPSSQATSSLSPGMAYLAERRKYYQTDKGSMVKPCAISEQVIDQLSMSFVQCKIEHTSQLGSRMHALSFLVWRDKVEAFREAGQQLKLTVSAKTLLSGPWPPYNFVDVAEMNRKPGQEPK
jgi:Gas vesicle synthesis protein GvpL/GvpF